MPKVETQALCVHGRPVLPAVPQAPGGVGALSPGPAGPLLQIPQPDVRGGGAVALCGRAQASLGLVFTCFLTPLCETVRFLGGWVASVRRLW